MFHPVGPQPPTVYWRRRLVLLGSIALLIILLALTVKTVTAKSDGSTAAAGTGTNTTSPSTTHVTSPSHTSRSPSSTSTSPSSSPRTSSSAAAPLPCAAKDLSLQAVAAKSSYQVGDQPVLELQVTNTGSKPCVQDLADRQVELRVYNGESRVWGSHDCQVQPGTNERVLAVNTPVRVAVTWSGLTSQPRCAGTRQRVGAGTYTLYAELSGHTGKATQFTIG